MNTESAATLGYNFKRGKFILENVSSPKLRKTLSHNAYWTTLPNDCYETENLGAASVYRRYITDVRVKKIFFTAFQGLYQLPMLMDLPAGFETKLDPHQMEGLLWILSRKRSYLAHAPGAGKTAQAILASCLAEPRMYSIFSVQETCSDISNWQNLFIVPPSLTKNWEREILKFTDWLGIWPAIGVVPSSAKKDDTAWRADFVICPDSMLTKPWVYERLLKMKKRIVVVDEASRFKEPLAERSLAFYGGKSGNTVYPGIYQHARHVVFMDGSPMPNRPMELWAPTYALDPEAIDCLDQNDFGYRYCGARPNERGQWEFLGSSNEEELRVKLQKRFMHVVKEDALKHPERLRSMTFMDQDVRSAEQKTWERDHLGKLSSITEDASQGDLARFRRELGVKKIPWAAKYIGERLRDKNESILVFAWHRDVCIGLHNALSTPERPAGLVIGGTAPAMREGLFEMFQKGEIKLLILNIGAAARGHNLQRADRVIFAEFSWTDELNKQCEKRASRRGSTRLDVRCEYLACPGSIDELVLNSVFTKERRVKKVIG